MRVLPRFSRRPPSASPNGSSLRIKRFHFSLLLVPEVSVFFSLIAFCFCEGAFFCCVWVWAFCLRDAFAFILFGFLLRLLAFCGACWGRRGGCWLYSSSTSVVLALWCRKGFGLNRSSSETTSATVPWRSASAPGPGRETEGGSSLPAWDAWLPVGSAGGTGAELCFARTPGARRAPPPQERRRRDQKRAKPLAVPEGNGVFFVRSLSVWLGAARAIRVASESGSVVWPPSGRGGSSRAKGPTRGAGQSPYMDRGARRLALGKRLSRRERTERDGVEKTGRCFFFFLRDS